MSEDFDKEAERERLREKYESDEADREATERMSELLLQGATMTNKHCDTCGSPIFRYQGQEFCPTCQAEGQPAAQSAGQSAGESQPEREDSPAEPGVGASTGGADPAAGQPDPATAQVDAGAGQTPPGTEPTQAAATKPTQSEPPATGRTAQPAASGAQESLSQTIAVLAERARTSEDPQQAKAFLEAAREAAEALAALAGR
ncbi:hypothetical protein HTSR_0039 [Halodesulfurarchaeum formicicum]|uniref:Sjogrens syndrome scleroderma autoantigen 1 n=1 Tax=Halodesulfurarchaeum formicicum TaxID=1873524 RepID=A0A1D8S1L3_9EURY|nr:Sjogren's syndrome/scleroderma autoantigen 1 family protein [Halodesulfurarchaeum formicicum]AOW79249.1 hypothetical protein HTSR_0039 [Halodesulfurarchaeum formicicum]